MMSLCNTYLSQMRHKIRDDEHIESRNFQSQLYSPAKTCPQWFCLSYKSPSELTETLSIFHPQYIKLQNVRFLSKDEPFLVDHRNRYHVVVVLRWIFSCNEQSAVSVTCWGDQTSFIPRANKPHRLCCQKHHPFNRDESDRGQPA